MPRLHNSILTASYSMYNTVHCIVHKEDEVSNEIEGKVCFHFSVLIVTCYRWPVERVGYAVTNTRLTTVRNNSTQTFINLCQHTCYQSQNFSTMQALLWGLFNLLWHPCQQFDTNQFFRMLGRPTKLHFSINVSEVQNSCCSWFHVIPKQFNSPLTILWQAVTIQEKKKL